MQFRRRSSLTDLLVVAAAISEATSAPLTTSTAAQCQCGFQDDQGRIWRESIISDFTGNAMTAVNANWAVQTNTWESVPLARQNMASNVYDMDGGLGLRTNAYDNSGTTKISEIQSQRGDILFGTFRFKATVPSTPGVVTGFFTYNGTVENAEADIEFRSADANSKSTVHYSTQPSTSIEVPVANGNFDTVMSEHRFDWLPGTTNFYINSAKQGSLSVDVPTLPSKIIANVWSSGNAWTAGPPKGEAVAKVQYIRMYFNSTSTSDATLRNNCRKARQYAPCTAD